MIIMYSTDQTKLSSLNTSLWFCFVLFRMISINRIHLRNPFEIDLHVISFFLFCFTASAFDIGVLLDLLCDYFVITAVSSARSGQIKTKSWSVYALDVLDVIPAMTKAGAARLGEEEASTGRQV
uniref:Uncharacterized protein n=1 Tax=Arundo donax TaxID=35708 RepID=A0A0A9GYJ0_ARUDO